MIDIHILDFLKLITVKLCCETEYALYGVVEFEIRLHILVIEGITLALKLIAPERIIPR